MTQECINTYNEAYYRYTGTNGYPLDYKGAVSLFCKAAELGSSQAMNYLGIIYENGKLVQQNLEQAFAWFNKALQTDPENIHALYNLARMYYNGMGTSKNIIKAFECCRSIIDKEVTDSQLYAKACYLAGCILMSHNNAYNEAHACFESAARYGNIPEAWHNLGFLAAKGIYSVDVGDGQWTKEIVAINYYETAASLGYLPSLEAAANLYYLAGQKEKALQLLQTAVSKGYEPAKKMLKLIKFGNSGSFWDLLK